MIALDEFYRTVWEAEIDWRRAGLTNIKLRVPHALWARMRRDAVARLDLLPRAAEATVLGIPVEPVSGLEVPEMVTDEWVTLEPGLPVETVVYRRQRLPMPKGEE